MKHETIEKNVGLLMLLMVLAVSESPPTAGATFFTVSVVFPDPLPPPLSETVPVMR